MLNVDTNKSEIFIGSNAGDSIYTSLRNAQKSIKILSPYVSSEYIDILLEARAKGVDVLLLTNSDMANPKKREEIYAKLIIQQQHVNVKAKKTRLYGILYSLLFIFAALATCYWGYQNNHTKLLWVATSIPVFALTFHLFRTKRIYTYSYETFIKFGVFINPYEQKIGPEHYFVHSKIYSIDDEVAYVGSVNFTKKAFRHNYECCVKIEDTDTVLEINQEILNLIDSENAFYKNINEIGSSLFPEPRN